MMDLSVVIVTWNTRELTATCVENLLGELEIAETRFGISSEVIVVDNGSSDGTADHLEECFGELRLVRLGQNLGFAAGNNRGFRCARGRMILLLNTGELNQLRCKFIRIKRIKWILVL